MLYDASKIALNGRKEAEIIFTHVAVGNFLGISLLSGFCVRPTGRMATIVLISWEKMYITSFSRFNLL